MLYVYVDFEFWDCSKAQVSCFNVLRCNFPSTSSYYVALQLSLLITLQAIRPLTAGDSLELEQMETPLDAERLLEFKEHALLFWKGE